jgi:glycosyltransferase involved in cell wall biosynthesis
MPINVLTLTRYGNLGASSRLRFLQYKNSLKKYDVNLDIQPFFSDDNLNKKYFDGKYKLISIIKCILNRILVLSKSNRYDLIWIEKEALPWCPLWLERYMLKSVPYVLDFDDAIFHNYDLHNSKLIRLVYGKRIDKLMSRSALVICGNDYLIKRAKNADSQWVEYLPTVVDLKRYSVDAKSSLLDDEVPRIVWIGSPSTVRYLDLLLEPLKRLAERKSFIFRIIGADITIPGINTEYLPWNEETEVKMLKQCNLGIMPLTDNPWEHGKCGYKLIQYMACSLPVVASPVGINSTIVQHGFNGFLANDKFDWLNFLEECISKPGLMNSLGKSGRLTVEKSYSLEVNETKLANMLLTASKVN